MQQTRYKKYDCKRKKKETEKAVNFVLCTITDDAKKLVQCETKVGFADDVKFNTLLADLLPSTKDAGIMSTIDGKFFCKITKIPGSVIWMPCAFHQC